MSRSLLLIVLVIALSGVAGCCASPWRMYQNAYGFNCPVPDRFCKGPPPPVNTPPGPNAPALPKLDTEDLEGLD